jgi:4-diphosphocytidyl-2-C-methyl-D-erythritol kinase
VKRIPAPAKLNLALVVGPRRTDGRHEVATVLQRLDLADRITVTSAPNLEIAGFREDTLVRGALERLAAAAGVEPRWRARIEKRIPVASGLGGGSSDAASALVLANGTLPEPLEPGAMHELAVALGADVPFFLGRGPALGTGAGADLSPLELPQDFWVVLLLPAGQTKRSTADVYAAFDARAGHEGFDERCATLLRAIEDVRRPRDLAGLPLNDLVSSPVAAELLEHGAFRADVCGAGPTVYGLSVRRAAAERAVGALRSRGRIWVTVPAWYG